MKKIIIALVLVLALSSSAFALFASGKVDDEVEYSRLKVTSRMVTIEFHNQTDKRIAFRASMYLMNIFDDVLGECFFSVALGPKKSVKTSGYVLNNTGKAPQASKVEWERYH